MTMQQQTQTFTSEQDADRIYEENVAKVIRAQMGMTPLLMLGAQDFTTVRGNEPGLEFTGRILPFDKEGTRLRKAEKMKIRIILTPLDEYNITVTRANGEEFLALEGIYCFQLAKMMMALDYDGDQVLNPRCI